MAQNNDKIGIQNGLGVQLRSNTDDANLTERKPRADSSDMEWEDAVQYISDTDDVPLENGQSPPEQSLISEECKKKEGSEIMEASVQNLMQEKGGSALQTKGQNGGFEYSKYTDLKTKQADVKHSQQKEHISPTYSKSLQTKISGLGEEGGDQRGEKGSLSLQVSKFTGVCNTEEDIPLLQMLKSLSISDNIKHPNDTVESDHGSKGGKGKGHQLPQKDGYPLGQVNSCKEKNCLQCATSLEKCNAIRDYPQDQVNSCKEKNCLQFATSQEKCNTIHGNVCEYEDENQNQFNKKNSNLEWHVCTHSSQITIPEIPPLINHSSEGRHDRNKNEEIPNGHTSDLENTRYHNKIIETDTILGIQSNSTKDNFEQNNSRTMRIQSNTYGESSRKPNCNSNHSLHCQQRNEKVKMREKSPYQGSRHMKDSDKCDSFESKDYDRAPCPKYDPRKYEDCHSEKGKQHFEKSLCDDDKMPCSRVNVRENFHQLKDYLTDDDDDDDGEYQEEEDLTDDNTDNCTFVYRKLSWETYIKNHEHLPDWEYDANDAKNSFEIVTAHLYSRDPDKKHYRDLIPYEHHDAQDEECRGWDKGEFVFLGEVSWGKRGEDSEGGYNKNAICSTGARPKTHPKWDRYQEFVCRQSDDDGDGDYRSHKNSSNRRSYFLDSEYEQGEECPELGDSLRADAIQTRNLKDEKVEAERTKALQNGYQDEDSRDSRPKRTEYDEDYIYSNCTNKGGYAIANPDSANEEERFDPCDIVRYLSQQNNFSSPVQKILGRFECHENVKKFFRDNSHIFYMNEGIVKLKPKIIICLQYITLKGCSQKATCQSLHICEEYIAKRCNDWNCIKGHRFNTSHNKKVLRSFFMHDLEQSVVEKILVSTLSGHGPVQELGVCQDYNVGNCKSNNCSDLHICLDYVVGLTQCLRPQCHLNHILTTTQCTEVLKCSGYDIDLDKEVILLTVLKKNPKLFNLYQKYCWDGKAGPKGSHLAWNRTTSNIQSPVNKKGHIPPGQSHSRKSSCSNKAITGTVNGSTFTHEPSQNSLKEIPSDVKVNTCMKAPADKQLIVDAGGLQDRDSITIHENKQSFTKKFTNVLYSTATKFGWGSHKNVSGENITKLQKQGNSVSAYGTVWSRYSGGDVELPEICRYALKGVCRYESNGCKRLHALRPFHWQFKTSNDGGWINLQEHQVLHLELNYYDPSVDSVYLPTADSVKEPPVTLVVLGKDKWKAKFETMELVMERIKLVYRLRRLGLGKHEGFSQFLWYFKDNNDKWIQYGQVDSSGDSRFAVNITSTDIEKQYLNNSNRKMSFKKGIYRYTIDFSKMIQTNTDTLSNREVRRRPKYCT